MDKLTDADVGSVIEVNGELAKVELTVDTTAPLAKGYYPGQPGSYLEIPFLDHKVIGMVVSVGIKDGLPLSGKAGATVGTAGRRVAECVLIGTFDAKGKFCRGVAVYPNVGQTAKMVSDEELKTIFSEFREFGFSFGHLTQSEEQRVFLDVDRFFGHHVAVVGTTGCGKSCTVVSILQQAIRKYPDTHIIVLDLHGEYAAAFPEDVLLIEADKVELPYWILNFDEFTDLTIDPNEATAKNQVTVLRDAIARARQLTAKQEHPRTQQPTPKQEDDDLATSVTVDSPIHYDLEDLLGQIRNWNIQMIYDDNGKLQQGPLYGVFDRYLIRFDSKMSDPRFSFMFKSTEYRGSDTLADLLKRYLSIDSGKRMAIIDLSGVPSEAVGTVAAVVSRVAFEFNLWNPDRYQFPILLVYEEAHNYIPNRTDARFASARVAVERVAKEGRKYGVGAVFVSQRPKEMSETVIAQCNNFVAMRLTNPEDQDYVRRLVPDSAAGLMTMIPALRTGEAMVLGDAVAMPTRMLVDCPEPKPRSSSVEYSKWWSSGLKGLDVERVVKRWQGRRKDI